MLDIPAGAAALTLMDFAKQANVEIVFDAQGVSGVETNAVHGEYEPLAALSHMLEDTSLGVYYDKETGAYAIIKI